MSWLKRRRRDRLRRQPFPPEWEDILSHNVLYYSLLPDNVKAELRGHVQVLIAEKNWEGCGGLEMTDEIKVTVAGQAAVLLLHRETDYFPELRSILVYPEAFVAPTVEENLGDEFVEGEDVHYGQSWDWGTVVLSWRHALRGTRNRDDGNNLILHEFAHQLDHEDGVTNGTPLLDDEDAQAEWGRVLSGEFEQLWRDVEQNRRTLIDDYGATDPSEFFAVVTECFFERPHALQKRHPELYDVLRQFYRQDPAALRDSAGK
ncbi:MAG: zinc-dependent peptidase [Candidatus Hydrogenedentes bacterium]|nr:zinc-dependent peptidase [Candidatus Hydrogenedentota bacterium]